MPNNNIICPVDVNQFLPHKPPMRMVDRILSVDDDSKSSIIETTIRSDFPFLGPDNSLQGEALIEIMAQAAAAQHGYNLKREEKKEEKGFIVGIRKFEIKQQAHEGDLLEISVKLGPEIESLSVVYCKVFFGGDVIASAELTVWHNA